MMVINNRKIGEGYPVYIIAEIGINHNGQLDLALKMVEEAAKAGVDAIKFQMVDADRDYTKSSESYSIFKKVELSLGEWEQVVAVARKYNVDIFASFARPEMIDVVKKLGMPAIKVSSGNLTNHQLLKALSTAQLPLLLSTGMSFLSEIDEAVRYLENNGNINIGILQCTSLYPAPPENVNLRVLETLKQAFPQYSIGFSDHTKGAHCAVAAVALGAKIIEKHFTLDRSMPGHDHHFSIMPIELKELVSVIREAELALGSSDKKPVAGELVLRGKLRRSLVAARDLREGEELNRDDIAVQRSELPGLETKYYDIILGRKIKRAIVKDTPFSLDLI